MILSFAASLGLLAQLASLSPQRVAPDPVRVWRTDSTVQVALERGGHVALLHVDPLGRIVVLFPLEPDLDTWVASDAPLRMALPPAAEGNPATFVAIRSRWPFDFAALRAGPTWNYHDALLLQPTAGDPLAALLDIADRVTDGRPYDYGVVAYTSGGAVATRRVPLQPDVCLSCVRQGTPAVAAATAMPTNAVDCSNASLTNSFCGVNSGSVSIAGAPAPSPQAAYQAAPAPAAAPVYVPYFLPLGHGLRRRFEPPPPPVAPAPRLQGVAFPLAPRLVVPSSSQLRTLTGRHH